MSEHEPPRPRKNPRQRPGNVRSPGAAPEADGAPLRARPNPRAEQAGRRERPATSAEVPAAETPVRQRRDPRDRLSQRQSANTTGRPVVDAILRLEQPSAHILAVLDLDGGTLARSDRDLLGACRALADEIDAAVVAFICSAAADAVLREAGSYGIDRVIHLADPIVATGLLAQRVDAVVGSATMLDARHVVFNDTAIGGELGRRVAARLGDRAAIGAIRLSAATVTCVGNAGQSEVTGTTPRTVILRLESFDPVAATPRREARIIPAPTISSAPLLQDLGLLPVEPAAIPLDEADLIVSAGNGVADWSSFHELARVLGAAEGGSRVVVDAGSMPRDRQIGASGMLVSPRCYIALGISGASQHLDGIVDCPRVVAVNCDPHADIVKRADLAVIGDVQAIMPALIQQARGMP